jgi:GNAT superfamily N-acetyltransferase
MNAQSTIREASLDDVPVTSLLLATLFAQEADFHPDPEKQSRGLSAIVEAPDIGRILVLQEENAEGEAEITGMVNLLFTISTAEGGRVAILDDLVIREDKRGGGRGSRLLQAAIDLARTENCLRITLNTDHDNEGARRLYEKSGFRASAMQPMRLMLSGKTS